MTLDIPQRLLASSAFTELEPRHQPFKTRYTVPRAMIDWMHEHADKPFRFVPILEADEGESRAYPVAARIHGDSEDLMLFRINFGF